MTAQQLNELFLLRRDLRTAERLLASLRSAVPDSDERLSDEICGLSERIARLKEQIAEREPSAVDFIKQVDDSQTRLIFQLRFLHGYSWRRIARTVGGGNTVSGVRMRYARYMKSCAPMCAHVP